MAEKPSSKPLWATTGDKTEPAGSKKATGWLRLEKPPYQFMNWLFNTIGEFIDYLSGNVQYNIIVGGDSDERDYATMAAYIADSPSAGDRVLIKGNEVLTATLIIPDGIEITMLKSNKFALATNFSPIIQLGDNIKIKGELRVENSDTGTIAKGFSFSGDNSHSDNLIIENKDTGTITSAFYIEAGSEGNYSQCRSINSGAGAITNDLTDNSANDENHVTVKGDSAISRSRGAKKFDQPSISDLTNMQHDHSNAANGGVINFRGALAKRDSSQSIPNNVLTTIEFEGADVYDTDSIHDPASNNSRLTVPAGATFARVITQIYWENNSTGRRELQLFKNGSTFPLGGGVVSQPATSGGDTHMNLTSAVFAVSGGDFLEIKGLQISTISLNVLVNSWFAMEIIE